MSANKRSTHVNASDAQDRTDREATVTARTRLQQTRKWPTKAEVRSLRCTTQVAVFKAAYPQAISSSVAISYEGGRCRSLHEVETVSEIEHRRHNSAASSYYKPLAPSEDGPCTQRQYHSDQREKNYNAGNGHRLFLRIAHAFTDFASRIASCPATRLGTSRVPQSRSRQNEVWSLRRACTHPAGEYEKYPALFRPLPTH